MFTLVLGGARSGKSAYAQKAAETKALESHSRLTYIATGEAGDAEMEDRITRHQADRGDNWTTVETPIALPETILTLKAHDVAVVDCLTLWVSNLLMHEMDVEENAGALLAALEKCACPVWLVSNEVGGGIVPENALARRFRDACGHLHQQLAARAEGAVMMVAGVPLKLK